MKDNSSLILELWERVQRLENEIELLKRSIQPKGEVKLDLKSTPRDNATQGKRDTTKYEFEGKIYGKSRLVLAIVKAYVKRYPATTRTDLKRFFYTKLQGSFGVVENKEIAEKYSDYEKRFFTKQEDIIALSDGVVFVCTQWGIGNINKFIDYVNKYGFSVTTKNFNPDFFDQLLNGDHRRI